MMKKNIIDSIEDLKHYTHDSISSVQSANIPTRYNLQLIRNYNVNLHGVPHTTMNNPMISFSSINIPYTPNQPRHSYIDTLENLVKSGEVYPFLLFMNHKFIKWSKILIVKDCKYSYLILLDYDYEVYTYNCILIPQLIKYNEDGIMNNNTIFAFDNEDKLICNSSEDKCTTIDLVNTEDIYIECENIANPNKVQTVNKDINLEKENIIMFCNGYLAEHFTVTPCGLSLFTVSNGLPRIPDTSKLHYKVFYYKNGNKPKDNIQVIKNKEDIIEKILKEEKVPAYFTNLNHKFNFKYDKKISYEENVYNSLVYIMKYNSSLLNNIYKEKNKIISKIYTGEQLLSRRDKNGYITMSRNINSDFSSHVVIFKNGELFKGYSQLRYKHNTFIYPALDISENDKIEILYFKDIDNRVIDMVLRSNGNDDYFLNSNIKMNNMKLFTTTPEEPSFNIEKNDSIQYEINYKYEIKDGNIIKIIPDNSYYYDKRLSLVSERQFKYFHKLIKHKCVDISLPSEFKFCNDKYRYMVFINGRKIDNENIKLTITKETRPFDDISVYLNIVLNENDKLEVLYVPDVLEEVVIEPRINNTGTIIVNKDNLKYNLSKDLYLFFINGKKINSDQIIDIDQNKLKIISDVKSIENLSIIKHIPDEELIASLFSSDIDEVTSIINSINEEDMENMFKGEDLTNEENSIKSEVVSMKSVMYKLIKDYFLRPYIYNGDEFEYDFDDEVFDKDEDGNIILDSLDANIEDKIEI